MVKASSPSSSGLACVVCDLLSVQPEYKEVTDAMDGGVGPLGDWLATAAWPVEKGEASDDIEPVLWWTIGGLGRSVSGPVIAE